jgi:hypothetical protein
MNTSLTLLAALSLSACQKDISTEFPAGLEPLDGVLEVTAPADGEEGFNATSGTIEDEYSWAQLAGNISADMMSVWECLKDDDVMVDRRSVTSWEVTDLGTDEYDFHVEIYNLVEDIVDVEFTTEWRQGLAEDASYGEIVAVRWAKIEGSDFLPLMEGSMLLLPIGEDATEIQIVEHLDALQTPEETAYQKTLDYYEELRLCGHGEPLPTYE